MMLRTHTDPMAQHVQRASKVRAYGPRAVVLLGFAQLAAASLAPSATSTVAHEAGHFVPFGLFVCVCVCEVRPC